MTRELTRAAGLYAALALAMTWPLASRLGSEVPIGNDNLHLAWALAWIAHAVFRAPLSLFDGNVFHPAAKSIAFSDPNVSSALLVAPAWWLGGSAGLLVNLLFLSSFVLCGLAAHALAREWGASALGGHAAGVLFAFSPMRFSHVDHVQLYAFWWTPLALLAIDRFLRTASLQALAAGTLCLVLQAYASLYLAAFAAAAVVVSFLSALVNGRVRIGASGVPAIAIAVGSAVLLCVPLALAYAEVRIVWGATRSLDQNIQYAASPLAYVSVPPQSVVWGRALAGFTDPVAPWEKQLFPGLVALVLALVAVVREPRSWMVRFGLALTLVGVVCSLGPVLVWRGERTTVALPYLVAWQWLPPLQGLRGPARWALLASLGLALVGAAGASRLPRAAVTALLAFAVVEAWVHPLPTTLVPVTGSSRLDEWLARSDAGAVIELPLANSGDLYETESIRIYRSTLHWRRIVNGYSGFTPPSYGALRRVLASEPVERVLPVLATWGVKTIVLHTRELGDEELERWLALADRGVLRRAFDDDGVLVLEHDLAFVPPRRLSVHVDHQPELRTGEWAAAKIVFEHAEEPIALPPHTFGWHRGLARWTARGGATVATAAKYFCPPIVDRSSSRQALYLVAPEVAGSYALSLEADCFELAAEAEVASAPR